MGRPHVVAIPYPAQGHVIPLLELMQSLAKQGFKITFVNTNFNHKRVMNSSFEKDNIDKLIDFVSIPDGLDPWEDRNDLGKLSEAMGRVMLVEFEELLKNINQSDDENISCVISDMGWALKVAEKVKLNRAYFWPAAVASLDLMLSVQNMIDDGIIDERGNLMRDQKYQLSSSMPTTSASKLPWALGDSTTQEIIFQLVLENNSVVQTTDWLICNSFYDLETAAFSLIPNLLPIGPLLASNRIGKSTGYFWPEDSNCLEWLNHQQPNSVIYIAFGSFTVFDNTQFKELALGLENTNRPFLWVVRPDITDDADDAYPEGFNERVANRGKIIGWAPQQMVLSHRSIACFVSHCGWNSTMEGLSNGVPFLCWPYFADQFVNQSYICDVWKVGLGFDCDDKGIITREEVKDKVENLIIDKSFKERALQLKEMAADSLKEGGRSRENLNSFIEWIKK